MTTSTTPGRRRRLVAAALAVPLSLAMTGSAFATGSTTEVPTATAEGRTAALVVPSATGGSPAEKAAAAAAAAKAAADKAAADDAAAEKAAAEKAAAEKAAAARAAADRAAADRAAADRAAADRAAAEAAATKAAAAKAPASKAAAAAPTRAATAPGSAAGSAAGTSTGGTFAHGGTNSSKAERPTAPVPGTPSQPLSTADKNGTGANPGTTCDHSYCSNGTGLPSGNGVGDGKAVGQPCAGCVGKADNKNPKGQFPNGSDRNAGYECDTNKGIGQTNPAHTGCTTGSTTPPATQPDRRPTRRPTQPPQGPQDPQNPGQGTAVMTIGVTCTTVTVTSSKDISNVVVRFTDGSSVKFDGLSGLRFTRTFPDGRVLASATAKSATTTVRGTSTGCGALPGDDTSPAPTCPDGTAMPPSGKRKDCVPGTTPKQPAPGERVTICHATGNPNKPYTVIPTDGKGLEGHDGHEDDIVPMPAGGCPAPGETPPADACPDLKGIQEPGTSCTIGGGGGGGGTVELCPNGAVMRDGDPRSCPKAPPVCPTVMPVTGPVQAGCQEPVPPTDGGGSTTTPPTGTTPIDGVTPDQGSQLPPGTTPVGTVPGGSLPGGGATPGAPATTPVGPSTGIATPATTPQLISGLATGAAVRGRAVPSALPFTGTDAVLLGQLGALLLLIGSGIAVTARRERTARAA